MRLYSATHLLGNIPDAQHEPDQASGEKPTIVACYGWYREDLDPTVKDDLRCIADDLRRPTMKTRTLAGPPTRLDDFTMKDTAPAKDFVGGFSLEKDPTKKPRSIFIADQAPQPPATPLPPFGETRKYVTAMQLFPDAVIRNAGTRIIDLTLPLQPGLIEAVRELLRHEVLSRVVERPVPAVVPLLSPTEVATTLHSWQAWKEIRKAQGKDTGKGDTMIAKLQDYQGSIEKYRTLRAELPKALAAVLKVRSDLNDKIDQWIQSRMDPYRAALAERDKDQELIDAW